MPDPRADGPTFAPENIGWIDFETKSETTISAGTTRYATEADAIVLAFAIGEGPVQLVAAAPLELEDMPTNFLKHARRVQKGEAIWAAWNAGFDRAIWNYATLGFPEMKPHHIIDVMAQATASGLPPDLKQAAIQSGSTCKVEDGKKLINLFCVPGATATPQSHPDEWELFLDYAAGDVEAMRSVFLGTRQLPLAEWQEYWAMEAINDRGIAIDLPMVEAAAALAAEDAIRSNRELARLTAGQVTTVNQVAKMTEWLLARLPEEGQKIITEVEEELDENGTETVEAKYQLSRKRVERLIAFCSVRTDSAEAVRVLQIRLYGGSKIPAKFKKMLQQQVDGRLYGQYVFNGAAQTGRASSKGVQIHNLARDTLPYEIEALDSLTRGDDWRQFAAIGDDSPVARKLSLLIRPSFVPTVNSNVFVWSDWSQIEARVLPWLCDHLPGAAARLGTFRAVDADPDVPDLYTRTAADLAGISVDKVTKLQRQSGKVAELALGFCGGKGALQAMAANYGLFFDDGAAQAIVDRWRKVNAWAVDYSQALWQAALRAQKLPHTLIPAGRVAFYFHPDYLGGSLLCRLPSGRLLTYRKLRWEMVEEKNAEGLVIKSSRELTYARGYGRAKLWPGIFVENVTQAVAADVLRGTLVRLDNFLTVRLHTHDEVLVEAEAGLAEEVSRTLRFLMQLGFDWSEGLPLMSEETVAYYYSKNEGSHGL
jgi:DNA polymerase